MTPEIKVTKNYSLFSFKKENRPVHKGKVRNMEKSILRLNLTMYEPVLITKGGRVIDGQYRLQSCMNLGLPIYYVVLDANIDEDEAMIVLNQTQSQWRQEDFLNYHAEKLEGCWKDLQEWDNKYKLGISNAVVLYGEKQMNASMIRKGMVSFNKNPQADDIAEFLLSDEIKCLPYARKRQFVIAVRHAFEKYTPKGINMLKKKCAAIAEQARYDQFLTAFENLIGNKYLRKSV